MTCRPRLFSVSWSWFNPRWSTRLLLWNCLRWQRVTRMKMCHRWVIPRTQSGNEKLKTLSKRYMILMESKTHLPLKIPSAWSLDKIETSHPRRSCRPITVNAFVSVLPFCCLSPKCQLTFSLSQDDKCKNALKAKLRRMCERKSEGRLSVPEWLHEQWKTRDHLEMALVSIRKSKQTSCGYMIEIDRIYVWLSVFWTD